MIKSKRLELLGISMWTRVLDLYHQVITSDFIHRVAETFTTQILLVGIGLIASIIVARSLGPEGYGLYVVATTIGAIGIQFGNLGLHASNTYYLANDKKLLPALVGNTLVVSFCIGGLGGALAWIIFLLCPNLAPIHGLLLILALGWIPLGLAYMLLQNLLLGIHEVRTYNQIELITRILGLSFIGLLIVFGVMTVETVFSTGLIVLVIGFSWTLWQIRRHFHCPSLPSLALFKKNIRYGLKAYVVAFFAFMVLRVDLLMVKYILGPKQAGYYSIAANMANMLYILPSVVGIILFPKLSTITDRQDKWCLSKKVTLYIEVIMTLLTILAVFLSKPAVEIIYGQAFLPSVAPFLILCLSMIFYGANNIISNYFASIGFPCFSIYVWIIASFLNIILNLYAIPRYGIVGAAGCSFVSYFTILLLQYLYALREARSYEGQSKLR